MHTGIAIVNVGGVNFSVEACSDCGKRPTDEELVAGLGWVSGTKCVVCKRAFTITAVRVQEDSRGHWWYFLEDGEARYEIEARPKFASADGPSQIQSVLGGSAHPKCLTDSLPDLQGIGWNLQVPAEATPRGAGTNGTDLRRAAP